MPVFLVEAVASAAGFAFRSNPERAQIKERSFFAEI